MLRQRRARCASGTARPARTPSIRSRISGQTRQADRELAPVVKPHPDALALRQIDAVKYAPQDHAGPGVFMARVRTGRDERLVLKRASPGTGASEVAALRAWSATGVTPRFVDEPEPGLCLVEWVEGTPLHQVADPRASSRRASAPDRQAVRGLTGLRLRLIPYRAPPFGDAEYSCSGDVGQRDRS